MQNLKLRHINEVLVLKKPLLSELTLEEKVGQMLLIYQYFINKKVDNSAELEIGYKIPRDPEDRAALLEREKYGTLYASVGAFNRGNAPGLVTNSDRKGDLSGPYGQWISEEASHHWIPALTATDIEREGPGTDFADLTLTCDPIAQGATDDVKLTYELAAAVAREARCAGVTWRWAPVVDMANRFSMSVMRSYAPHNPEKQIKFAVAQIQGTQSEGVAATAKHFPGSDLYEYRDSHLCPAKIRSTKEEWWAGQGKIFQGCIDGGVYSIMISHGAFPAYDDSKVSGRYRPATISKKIITDLLKGEMGFKGVVITDAINMAALITLMPYEDLIVELINAGNDVLLGVQRTDMNEIICKAVRDGRIAMSRIDDACQRILDMKEKLGMFEEGYTLVKSTAEVETPKTRKINMEIARKAIHLVRDRQNMLPLDLSKIKNVTIIASTHSDAFVNNLQNLVAEFNARGINAKVQRRLSGEDELVRISNESDLIIYAAYVAAHQPMGAMSLYGEEARTYLFAFSHGKEKSIGVSFGYPYLHYDMMGGVDAFINTYGQSPELMKAFVEAILGEIPFQGKAPVKLPEDDE